MNMSNIITDTGMNLPADTTEAQFFEAGRFLARIEHGMQWAMGDWYNAIPWGDKKAACEKVGLPYERTYNYGWVSSKFEISSRKENLSFDHHKKLAHNDLTADQRADLLQQAESGNWSGSRLAKERDRLLGRPEKVPLNNWEDKVGAVLETLPASASKKVRRAVKSTLNTMKHEFQEAVERELDKRMTPMVQAQNEERKRLEAEFKRASLMKANAQTFITREEYKIILSCLHPDRECPPERKQKAFVAFSKFTEPKK